MTPSSLILLSFFPLFSFPFLSLLSFLVHSPFPPHHLSIPFFSHHSHKSSPLSINNYFFALPRSSDHTLRVVGPCVDVHARALTRIAAQAHSRALPKATWMLYALKPRWQEEWSHRRKDFRQGSPVKHIYADSQRPYGYFACVSSIHSRKMKHSSNISFFSLLRLFTFSGISSSNLEFRHVERRQFYNRPDGWAGPCRLAQRANGTRRRIGFWRGSPHSQGHVRVFAAMTLFFLRSRLVKERGHRLRLICWPC